MDKYSCRVIEKSGEMQIRVHFSRLFVTDKSNFWIIAIILSNKESIAFFTRLFVWSVTNSFDGRREIAYANFSSPRRVKRSGMGITMKYLSFFKSGIVVLSIVLLLGITMAYSKKISKDEILTVLSNRVYNKELPIYCVDTDKPKIALSFDAAWGNEDTQEILKILKEKKINVTFFMTGGWIDKYPEDVKAIYEAGNELGNHSQNHKQMSTLSEEECRKEIMQPHEAVKKLTGYDMKVFRPPYGDYNDNLIRTAKACGYSPIQWDVEPYAPV